MAAYSKMLGAQEFTFFCPWWVTHSFGLGEGGGTEHQGCCCMSRRPTDVPKSLQEVG
ncbi:hypothetical protein PILCRDRAFT_829652 [Piloderma croceum F 1598]|uniref:Uncharacterized protein n=1 Tax=Piloderma croceum (strain F 1598) TaxID=765440 RepID=A0A0C3B5T4_PILCF|nr:hypothetical protein PILCRDRAFT_829652 [Piloderma croceum F 1598]